MSSARYLLCRPMGGLNDMLCQIARCLVYCRRTGRYLYVDGSRSGFLDDLSKYFEFSEDVSGQLSLSDEECTMLNSLQVAPASFSSRLATYQTQFGRLDAKLATRSFSANRVDAETGIVPTFDFDRDYDEAVLLHESGGGGLRSLGAVRKLRLQEPIARAVQAALAALGGRYHSIHIRSGDAQVECDYVEFFEGLSLGSTVKSIHLACDQRQVQDHARMVLSSYKVFTFDDLPRTGGRRLHENPHIPRWETNLHCIVDLVLLAGADNIVLAPSLVRGKKFSSGFSRLAGKLHRRPKTLNAFARQAVLPTSWWSVATSRARQLRWS